MSAEPGDRGPFWSVTDQRFECADELAAGEKVWSATLEGLNSGEGQRLVERSLITGPAQRLLQAAWRR